MKCGLRQMLAIAALFLYAPVAADSGLKTAHVSQHPVFMKLVNDLGIAAPACRSRRRLHGQNGSVEGSEKTESEKPARWSNRKIFGVIGTGGLAVFSGIVGIVVGSLSIARAEEAAKITQDTWVLVIVSAVCLGVALISGITAC